MITKINTIKGLDVLKNFNGNDDLLPINQTY